MIALRALAAAAALLAAPPALAKRPLGPADRVDLNRAGADELMRLPGVGRKRAQALLEWRARHPFRRLEDVLRVKGFSAAWLAKARPHLVVGPAQAPPTAAGRR